MSKAQPTSPTGDDAPVPARLRRFYERYPLGRIITHLVRRTDAEVMFRAELYRGYEDREPAATGWALERSDAGGATSVACVERAETSAVGRALANLGIDVASGQPDNAEHETVRGTASEQRRSNRAVTQRTPADPRADARTDVRLQQRADRVMEMAGLLGHAKRLGLSPAKLRVLRERVLRHDLDSETLTHIERRVRDWMERRMNRIEWRQ